MGEKLDESILERKNIRSFTRNLLRDLEALERMIEDGRLEREVRRIGAEQEMFLVDSSMRPATIALEILEGVDDDRVKTELGLFNLEVNLTPRELRGSCFTDMRSELELLLSKIRERAVELEGRILLTGIAPTMGRRDVSTEAMTPEARYQQLDETIQKSRGGPAQMQIRGLDELHVTHPGVLMEACNAAFQIHFQVDPDEFAPLYNLAQLITAPVLAASTNSPVFFQRRLWQETRLALFVQAVDDRSERHHERRLPPRVSFGTRWVDESVLEVFREDISRYRVYLPFEVDEDPIEVLERGGSPELQALCRFNGTVYRWNRPCYGMINGRSHLRIEHRVLPAGPTVIDEMANAALFLGLMTALSEEIPDVREIFEFDSAKRNFQLAGRYGLDARLEWPAVGEIDSRNLLLDRLIPIARQGLESKKVDSGDCESLLGIIEARVRSGRTGSRWTLDSLQRAGRSGKKDPQYRALSRAMWANQEKGEPVHEWPLAEIENDPDWSDSLATVDQMMTRELFTVREDDLIDLAACFMDWKHIRHVPVEDEEGKLVGLVSQRQLLRLIVQHESDRQVSVSDVMERNVVTIEPGQSCLDAIDTMRENRVSCLPVVEEGNRLVGIITERDFVPLTARLLEDHLRQRS